VGLYSFDGYRWLRDGAAIAGQSAQSYTPTGGDVGHQLACQITVTYPLPFLVTASATSAAITVITVKPPSVPALSGLRVSPHKFSLAGRRVKGHCVKPTAKNHGNKHCRRAIKLKISYTLSAAATVTFTLKKKAPGRKVKGRCVKPTKKNRKHKRCHRLIGLHGSITLTGKAGNNSFTFNGKLAGHKLAPGSYQLTATPTAGGRTGTPQRATFKLVR
jgi:hypothetical protein